MSSSGAKCLSNLPADVKFHILENLDGRDLHSMVLADPVCLSLWMQYPRQISCAVWNNSQSKLHPRAQHLVWTAFRLREVKMVHEEAMRGRQESHQDRETLKEAMTTVLLGDGDDSDDDQDQEDLNTGLVLDLESLAGHADMVRDVESLVDRYANDAWRRVQAIARETGTSGPSPTGTMPGSPKITLTAEERGSFQVAFAKAEIYLLCTFHTDNQGNRHRFEMTLDMSDYIPLSGSLIIRRQFDSCLRYIFHAYRSHLRSMAREMGVPEFAVGNEEDEGQAEPPRKRRRLAAPAQQRRAGSPALSLDANSEKFARRTVEEEQKFLLWLCESGIGPLVKTNEATAQSRRSGMLEKFTTSCSRDAAVRLQHFGNPHSSMERGIRLRHPVKNLYSRTGLRYGCGGTPWACAATFLSWKWVSSSGGSRLRRRGDVVLNEHGRWITFCDTDSGVSALRWYPFERKPPTRRGDHQYDFDRTQASFRPLPAGVSLPVH